MNKNISDFIKGMGAIAETWMIVFKGFIQQGLDEKSALVHTKALMECMMTTIMGGNGKGEE